MKYFRRHPDLIVFAQDPENTLEKNIIRRIKKVYGSTKKILICTNLRTFLGELMYYHQTEAVCCIDHGKWLTAATIFFLRYTGKRTIKIVTRRLTKKRLTKIIQEQFFPSPTLNLGIMGV